MSHRSENAHRLELVAGDNARGDGVHLFWLSSHPDAVTLERLDMAVEQLEEQAVVAVLTSSESAATALPILERHLQFQLWIAVKTSEPRLSVGRLPENHAALLILSKYRGALRHTKTRIGYSYCPACGKTTKDYGGKKHTYHEYGTLMSDVWRDISVNLEQDASGVIDRLRDVFGLEPLETLTLHDWRDGIQQITAQQTAALEPMDFGAVHEETFKSSLMNVDCLEQLARIPENSVDFCFADPPYNLKKRYDRWDDAMESRDYFAWCDEWLGELARVLKPGRTLAVLNIPHWAARHFTKLSRIPGLQFQNWIAWEGLSLPVRMIMPAHYGIVCFSKGQPRALPMGLSGALEPLADGFCSRATCVQNRNRSRRTDRAALTDLWSDVHRLKHNSRRVDHPCQLPPLLMERLIATFTNPGELVLDPFNGSGTTTLVAAQMKRRYIGIELSKDYHALTQRRHVELEAGVDPFGKNETVPKTKNNLVPRVKAQRYEVSKKTLQLEVKLITEDLGHIPTRAEVAQFSSYPLEYFDAYFKSWAEVTAAARTTGMTERPRVDPAQPTLFGNDD
jgi:DNA modification methylase